MEKLEAGEVSRVISSNTNCSGFEKPVLTIRSFNTSRLLFQYARTFPFSLFSERLSRILALRLVWDSDGERWLGWKWGRFVCRWALGEREKRGRKYTLAWVLGRVVVLFMYLSCEDARTYEKIFMIPSYIEHLVNKDWLVEIPQLFPLQLPVRNKIPKQTTAPRMASQFVGQQI